MLNRDVSGGGNAQGMGDGMQPGMMSFPMMGMMPPQMMAMMQAGSGVHPAMMNQMMAKGMVPPQMMLGGVPAGVMGGGMMRQPGMMPGMPGVRPPPPPPPLKAEPHPHPGYQPERYAGGWDGPRYRSEWDGRGRGGPEWRPGGRDRGGWDSGYAPPGGGGGGDWDRRPPSPRGYRFPGGPPRGWGGPPSPRPREDRDRPDVLFMSYEQYVDSFIKLKRDRGEPAGGGEAAVKAEPTAGGAGRQDVHLMTVEEYLEYCQRFTAQMGLPYDEAMVRQHYKQMKAAYEESGGAAKAEATGPQAGEKAAAA